LAENLESVEQAFISDLTRYLAGLDAGIAKAAEFAAANKEAEDAVAALALAANDAATVIASSMDRATRAVAGLASAMAALDSKHISVTASVSGISGPVAGAIAQVEALKAAMAGLGGATVRIGTDMSGAGARTAAATGMMAGGLRLTGAALHWIVMGTVEVAATAIPALVALGAAAAGMYPAFVHIYDQMSNLYVASGSLRGALLNSVGPLHALGVNFGQVSAAMAPDAYIIFGSVINDLTGRFGAFSQVAQQAGTVLAAFATKVTMDLQGPMGAQLAGFFANAVKYMIQWGQVLGNLAHGFANAINDMWGVSHILLDVLVGLSRAFVALTSNPVGAWLIGVAASMSALYRYSQLLVVVFGFLSRLAIVQEFVQAGIAAVAAAAEFGILGAAAVFLDGVLMPLVTLLMGPLGIAMAATVAGLGLWWLATRQTADATTQLIQQVQAMPPTLSNLAKGVTQLSGQLTQVTGATRQWTAVSHEGWKGAAAAGVMMGLAAQDTAALTAAIRKQVTELLNLEIGLAQTGAGTGAVAAGENALAISTALADSKVSQLNQALDQYMTLVTGGTAGLAAFTTSLSNIGSVAATTTNNLGTATVQLSLTARQFGEALSKNTAVGAAAWSNFDQIVGSTMPQLMDWFRQAGVLGAASSQEISRAALDAASSMLRYAGSNKTAQAEVLAFVQAQGLNIRTWPQLLAAVHHQGIGQADLQKKVDATTIALSHLSDIAKNTAAALNSQMSTSIATAALKTVGFQDKVDALTAAIQKYGANSPQAVQAARNLSTAEQQASNYAIQAAGSMDRFTNSAARAGNAAGGAARQVDNLILQLRGLHDKTVYLNIITTGNVPPQITIPGAHGASGGVIPGYAPGHDTVRAMLSPGEGILTPEAVRGLGAGFVHAANRYFSAPRMAGPGFGTGGIAPSLPSALRSAAHVSPALASAASGGGGGGMQVHNHYSVTVNNAGSVLAEQELGRTLLTVLNRQTGRNMGNQLWLPGRTH